MVGEVVGVVVTELVGVVVDEVVGVVVTELVGVVDVVGVVVRVDVIVVVGLLVTVVLGVVVGVVISHDAKVPSPIDAYMSPTAAAYCAHCPLSASICSRPSTQPITAMLWSRMYSRTAAVSTVASSAVQLMPENDVPFPSSVGATHPTLGVPPHVLSTVCSTESCPLQSDVALETPRMTPLLCTPSKKKQSNWP